MDRNIPHRPADFEGTEIVSVQSAQLDALRIPEGESITVHMVHLNHLDLTWYWRLPDAIEMCLETVRWHVDLLERHPDAAYSHTQVFILRVAEVVDPPLFQRFADLVRQGRIEVDSGQVVEPDHNLPSAESLVRQFLYGQRYLGSRFGVRARTLVNSDSFGHPRSLPQILRRVGIGTMIFKRPRQKFISLPETPFHWQGIDGTPILAIRFINKGNGLPSLSQYYDLPNGRSDLQEKVDLNLAAGVHHLLGSICISDAGGIGPYVPPSAGSGYRLRYSTPSEFAAALGREAAPCITLATLLNPIYQGCYTTHVHEKADCRRAETELRGVELLWSLAALCGEGYPLGALTDAWWRLCFLQFHDILSGTGTTQAHEDSRSHYHELFLSLYTLRRKAQCTLGRRYAPSDVERSILVATPRPGNSNYAGCRQIVEVDIEVPMNRDARGGPRLPEVGLLEDECGNRIPYQVVAVREFQRFIRGTLIFAPPTLTPVGITRFRYATGALPVPTVRAEADVLENEHLRLQVGAPGLIGSLITKYDERERLRVGGGASPVRIELWPETDYLGDYGTPMKAWFLGVTEARELAEWTSGPEVVENGPVRATLRMTHRWGTSVFRTEVSLYAGCDWVEVRMEIDWHEVEALARLCVEPNVIGHVRGLYGIPFGYEQSTGEEIEVAATGWADLSDERGGLALLDRDRPGHSFREQTLRASLVRCATGDWDPRTDHGRFVTVFRLVPHAGSAVAAQIPAYADGFTSPPIAWQADPGAGVQTPSAGLQLEGDGILLSALKVAEDGDGYVLRLHESLGRPATATLRLSSFCQVASPPCTVWETNLLEDALGQIFPSGDRLDLAFGPFEIKTLLVRRPVVVTDKDTACSGGLFEGIYRTRL